MPQWVIKDGQVVYVDPADPTQTPVAPPSLGPAAPGAPMQTAIPQREFSPEEWEKDTEEWKRLAGDALELGAGFMPGGPIPRLGAAALSGAIAGGLRNDESAVGEAVDNTALQGAAALTGGALRFGAKQLPALSDVTNWMATRLGGMKGQPQQKYVESLKNLNARQPSFIPGKRGTGRIAVGDQDKIDRLNLRAKAGQEIEAAENANSTRIPVSGFRGATDKLQKKAQSSTNPLDDIGGIRLEEKAALKQQAKLRGGKPKTATMSVRELGDFTRENAKLSGPILKKYEKGEINLASGELPKVQLKKAFADRGRELRRNLQDPMIEGANKHAGDVQRVSAGNMGIRNPGFITNIGTMGARAGFGAGIGTAATGGNLAGGVIGGVAGPVLFAPRPLSRAGYGAEAALQTLPHAARSAYTISDILALLEKEREK
jgi:hypothetical protein